MYYPYPPMPPYYPPQPTSARPEDLIAMLQGLDNTKKALQEILKDKQQPPKKPKSYNNQELLIAMAVGALPVGFIFWLLILPQAVRGLGRGFGLIP